MSILQDELQEADYVFIHKPTTPSQIALSQNLIQQTSYNIKQIVYSLGSYDEIAEIFFVNSVNGELLYDFDKIQKILTPLRQQFESKKEYDAFIQQMENQFKVLFIIFALFCFLVFFFFSFFFSTS